MLIDTHCHLAWDVDDGIETKQESMFALEQASRDGIKALIATPHFVPGSHKKQDIEEINMRIQELESIAKTFGIRVYVGAEIFLNHEYLSMIDEGLVNTLNKSRYLLVEFDVRKEMLQNTDAEDKLYELTLRGFLPIIAHVERYFHGELDIERVQNWIESGCVIQVNRTSILGMHGKQCQTHAEELLKHGLVHLVASDAHRATGNRICVLSDVVRRIEKLVGKENALLLCSVNPKAVIEDRLLATMDISKRGFLQRLLKKR